VNYTVELNHIPYRR